MRTSDSKGDKATCQWCGKSVVNQGRGRPKKYCSSACKQRAYEKRAALRDFSDNEKALTLSPERAVKLHDGLFELRCSAEDIAQQLKKAHRHQRYGTCVTNWLALPAEWKS